MLEMSEHTIISVAADTEKGKVIFNFDLDGKNCNYQIGEEYVMGITWAEMDNPLLSELVEHGAFVAPDEDVEIFNKYVLPELKELLIPKIPWCKHCGEDMGFIMGYNKGIPVIGYSSEYIPDCDLCIPCIEDFCFNEDCNNCPHKPKLHDCKQLERKVKHEAFKLDLSEGLKKATSGHKDADGYYTECIYASYDDVIPYEDVKNLLTDHSLTRICPNIKDRFEEYIREKFYDGEYEIYDSLYDSIVKTLKESAWDESYIDCHEDEIRSFIEEKLIIEFPYEHFINQRYCVDILVDTGDGNADFTLNAVFPHYDGVYGSAIPEKASLLWLAKQQGYSRDQFFEALNREDVTDSVAFLDSVWSELANCGSAICCLTFLVEMTLNDLIKLNELMKTSSGKVSLGKETVMGLYDPFNGSGGPLEIQLDRDVELPVNFIHSALPDCGKMSVKEVYGACGSCWKETLAL